MALKVKKNDEVVILTGKDKGKRGTVTKVLPEASKVIVGGLNMVKKHEKPSAQNQTGGIVDKEMPIHVSNVMVIDPKTKEPTRVARKREEGKASVRISVKSKNVLD